MDPMPALSKPRLPVPSRLPGCALILKTECLRLQQRNPAASATLKGCQSTLHRSDWDKCSLNSEQKRKANLSLFTYLNTVGACHPFGMYPKGTAYLLVKRRTP